MDNKLPVYYYKFPIHPESLYRDSRQPNEKSRNIRAKLIQEICDTSILLHVGGKSHEDIQSIIDKKMKIFVKSETGEIWGFFPVIITSSSKDDNIIEWLQSSYSPQDGTKIVSLKKMNIESWITMKVDV